jgi:two-component system, chemotaxis family, protein-glutamate methylesterase/glutaminase
VADPVSVLIVDDSALMRNLITRIVEATPGLRVADRAMNGVFALQKIPRCEPDIIVLDLEMPEMNGIEFLKERRKLGIDIPVIILSSIAKEGAEITMEALALGASDFIQKPTGPESPDLHTIGQQLSELLVVYGTRYRRKKGKTSAKPAEIERVLEDLEKRKPEPRQPVVKPERIVPLRAPGPIEIIAIGISTGGPNALRDMFAGLDADLPQPIVVVQHMPAGFTGEFAKSLDRVCPLDVKEAEDGDLVRPGRILIAPGDRHLEVERRPLGTVARLSTEPQMNGHRPSADVLFSSVSRQYQNRAVAVIMTGMGRDGARGIGEIYREGGITIGQDEASCVVYGMPRVAFELGNLTMQVSLSKMAETVCRIAKEHRS